MDILYEIAWRSALLFLWIGSALALLLGVGLLLAPARTERINRFFARWIDTRKIESELDRPRWTERFVYRHHRIVGAFILSGSVFVVFQFLLRPFRQRIAPLAAHDMFGLLDATVAFFIIGGVLGALIGLIILFKPSLLRELEGEANRWVSTEKFTRAFNAMYFSFDEKVMRHRRLSGLFLAGAGAYVFVILGRLLMKGYLRF